MLNASVTDHFVVALLLCGVLLSAVGCGSSASDDEPTPASESVSYVTTIPPFAMILRPVVDGRATVTTLLDPGDSPHTHDLRPSDLRAVSGSQALMYGARALDGWASDLPAAASIKLLDLLPPEARRTFGSVDGATSDTSSHASGRKGHDMTGVDPHFWTDPTAVEALLPALADTLCALDTAGCSTYHANADSFAAALATLDTHLASTIAPVRDVPVMLAQPFFRYFLYRYGPSLVGVVSRSPAHEPSPRVVQAKIRQARTASVRAVFTQQTLPPRAAEAVAEAASLPLYTLDPLGGTSGRTTYADLLRWNANRIRTALDAHARNASVGSASE